ncbi:hypothetical protein THIX_70134 [Thiomonas sp. X19]|uniref:hypothetical protein n=1 Tax=Thiomonas sp. X19 TaxID=1050370 RepID=UPI000B690B17|nr:hypothetical protein [Thiomonas sp. X19]SCC95105.1 hypothetical protein THIX_70134 [Thiomonas sp. X19]
MQTPNKTFQIAQAIYSRFLQSAHGDRQAVAGLLADLGRDFDMLVGIISTFNRDFATSPAAVQRVIIAHAAQIAKTEASKPSPRTPRHFQITHAASGDYEIELWSDADRSFVREKLTAKERALFHVMLGEIQDRRRVAPAQNPEPTNPTQH